MFDHFATLWNKGLILQKPHNVIIKNQYWLYVTLIKSIQSQVSAHTETNQLMCNVNQLPVSYTGRTFAINGLKQVT